MHGFVQSSILAAFYFLHTLCAPAYPNHARRGVAGAFYTCPEPGWKESQKFQCQWINPPESQCVRMSTFPDNFTFGSLGPDSGGTCFLYNTTDCPENIWKTPFRPLEFPGRTDVSQWGIKSIYCSKCNSSICDQDFEPPMKKVAASNASAFHTGLRKDRRH